MNEPDFEVFPEYELSRWERYRFQFFYDDAKHFRRGINEMARETEKYRIGVLYLYGPEQSGIQKYLEKQDGCLCVLHCVIPQETMDVYSQYIEAANAIRQSAGSVETLKEDIRRTEMILAKSDPEGCNKSYDASREWLAASKERARQYDAWVSIRDKTAKLFERYTVYLKGAEPAEGCLRRLWKLSRHYFPESAEFVCRDDRMYLMTKCEAMSHAGFYGKPILDNPKEKYSDEVLRRTVKKFQRWCADQMDECGYFSVGEIIEQLQKPPYGISDGGYAGYVLGAILSQFSDGQYFLTDSIGYYGPVDEKAAYKAILQRRTALARRMNWFYVQREYHKMAINAFEYIFEAKVDERLFWGVLARIMKYANGRTPYAVFDERLWSILNSQEAARDKRYMQETSLYLWQNRIRLRDVVRNGDAMALKLLSDRHPGVDSKTLLKESTTECSCWLWNQGTFWSAVDAAAVRLKNNP